MFTPNTPPAKSRSMTDTNESGETRISVRGMVDESVAKALGTLHKADMSSANEYTWAVYRLSSLTYIGPTIEEMGVALELGSGGLCDSAVSISTIYARA